jgi:glyoxylase-like metal-dependent hydrolase (beta-lactamase superfamily II)
MANPDRLNRRLFITELGRRSVAVALLGTGVVACSSSSDGENVTQTTIRTTTTRSGSVTTEVTTEQVDDGEAPSTTTDAGEPLRWGIASFDFVSAYVLARGSELAIVDTGVSGSAGRFDPAFTALGAGWDAVDHVILTHLHGDHVGGLGAALEAAPDALAYAGELDVDGIDSPRPVTPVNDGDEIFGLRIIGTPGHTPGHISVFDGDTGLLVAGDALNTSDALEILGPNPEFSSDMDTALDSVRRLATLGAATVVVGHGPPVESEAADKLNSLAAGL